MRKVTMLQLFSQECIIAVDQGLKISVQDVKNHIENGDLIDWLRRKYLTESNLYNGIHSFESQHIEYLQKVYYDQLMGYYDDEFRKWGIRNNGFNLLISWGIELLREENDDDII